VQLIVESVDEITAGVLWPLVDAVKYNDETRVGDG
jgi:hypothetical protein